VKKQINFGEITAAEWVKERLSGIFKLNHFYIREIKSHSPLNQLQKSTCQQTTGIFYCSSIINTSSVYVKITPQTFTNLFGIILFLCTPDD